jgi:hypothetical protein
MWLNRTTVARFLFDTAEERPPPQMLLSGGISTRERRTVENAATQK